MRRLLLVALLTVSVTMPAEASATSLPALRAALPAAVAIAEARWAPDPCDNRVRVVLMTRDALAVIRGADDADAQALVDTCTIDIAWAVTDTRTDLCATIVHERGHLHGVRFPDNIDDPFHSNDPRSIMFATILVAPRACMDAFPPYEVRRQRHSGDRCWPITSYFAWRCGRLLDVIPAV